MVKKFKPDDVICYKGAKNKKPYIVKDCMNNMVAFYDPLDTEVTAWRNVNIMELYSESESR